MSISSIKCTCKGDDELIILVVRVGIIGRRFQDPYQKIRVGCSIGLSTAPAIPGEPVMDLYGTRTPLLGGLLLVGPMQTVLLLRR